MRMGIVLNYWMGWLGGATFISAVIRSFEQVSENEIALVVLDASVRNPKKVGISELGKHENLKLILKRLGRERVDVYGSVERWLTDFRVSIVGPSFGSLNVAVPRITYIPDFQHKYLPKYFSDRELASREVLYGQTLNQSATCVVADVSVGNDIKRFFPWYQGNICVLPRYFVGLSDPDLRSSLGREVSSDLVNTDDQYLIVCSQRWAHKRHDLVLKAFGHSRHSFKHLKLVFTGPKDDYRDPSVEQRFWSLVHELGLSDAVIDLGILERQKQLSLVQNAVALITASEFEGGVGAAGVEEALFLGTPVICPSSPLFVDLYQDKNVFHFDFTRDDLDQFASCVLSALSVDIDCRTGLDSKFVEQTIRSSMKDIIDQFELLVP